MSQNSLVDFNMKPRKSHPFMVDWWHTIVAMPFGLNFTLIDLSYLEGE